MSEDCVVFPVVDSLKDYPGQVPRELHAVNGMEWDASRLTAEVLRALGLTREQRQAFISYKRDESSAVAVQLFDLLSHRGYRVFLDTFAVGPADLFQEALWGEMADVDLLIFLDTKSALTSRWVYQELARANDLGLGVLQILWPGLKRTPGTEFSDLISLRKASFQGGETDASGRLKETTLNRVLSFSERARIRSLKSRRDRVVSDLIDQARGWQLEAIVHPMGRVELRRSSRRVATAIPLVGVPDAAAIEHQERQLTPSERHTSRVVYDGLGVRPKWLNHLGWLNCQHRLNTSQVTAVDDWLRGL